MTTPNSTPYINDVAAHLTDLPTAARRAALADLRDLLAEGVTPADLGPAEQYATELRASLGAEPAETLGRVLGLPVDVRAPTSARVRSRVFDPTDSRILVPRILGAGWRLNYGALAVRLGLLRPDDVDDDVLAHVPPAVRRVTRAIPWVTAAKTAFWAAAAWRTGPRVPSHWDVAGRVDGWSDRRLILPALTAFATGAAWWGTRTDPDDPLVRPALAASAGATTTAIAVLTTWTARRPTRPHPEVAMVAIAPLATTAVMLIWPVRAGLRALAREASPPAP